MLGKKILAPLVVAFNFLSGCSSLDTQLGRYDISFAQNPVQSTLSINYNLTRDGGLTAGEHFINSYRAGRFADVADFMDQFLRLLERSKKPYTDEDLRKKDLDALSGMVEGAGMGSTGQLHILILMISSPHLPSGCKAVGISDAGGLNVQCSP